MGDESGGWDIDAISKKCFYCGESLTHNPEIYWSGYHDDGHSIQIYFHPDCLFKLQVRLSADLLKHHKETGEDLRTLQKET